MGEDVAVDTAESVGSVAVGEDTISSCCLIAHGDIRSGGVVLEARKE